MKRVMVLSMAALAILLSGTVIQAENKGKAKNKEKIRAEVKKTKELTEQDKLWKEKLKAMTPEQRRVAIAQKALETELAPWKEVRKIAAEEKAEKTVAAIDKIIAAKQAQLKKKLDATEKKKAAATDKPKAKNEKTGEKRREKSKQLKNEPIP